MSTMPGDAASTITTCKFCKKEIDTSLEAPDQNRKVLQWHWTCFQYIAINGLLHVTGPGGEDYTDRVLEVEFDKDEASK